MTRICPKCGSERVHRSHRRGVTEHLLSLCGFRSRRCYDCNTRFATFGSSSFFRSDLQRLGRNLSVVVLAMAAILAVVAVVMWLSRREANPPPATASAQPPAISAPANPNSI